MCGFVGFCQEQESINEKLIIEMSDKIRERGPDSSGIWINNKLGVAMAHRRLAILDLSQNGHQPMKSHTGRYVITFNGEIYNHLQLRKLLVTENGHDNFKSQSDTETLLAGVERWGVKDTLKKLNGMFAFALLDNEKEQIILARDRIGEKPLYY